MNLPFVSIIMPAYNAEKYIAEAIESVQSQTYQDWELLIVNDGSTDNTQEVIDKYVQTDDRIKSFFQQNGKQGKARNLAISHAKGEYLAFLDADDLWLPEKLEIQLQEITDSKADLVFSKSFIIDNEGIKKDEIISGHISYLKGSEGIEKMIEMNRVPILTVLVNKQSVLQVGAFEEDISIANAEDYHLWLKLMMNQYIFWGSDNVLASYRVLEDSATGSDKLSLNKLPFVYYDLSTKYKGYKVQLIRRLKEIFNLIYKFQVKNKVHFLRVLKLNCSLLNKNIFYILFFILSNIISLNRSKYLVKKYVNN
jgi:teichuronic acid biosynthesis glycosyltransferase TuaG